MKFEIEKKYFVENLPDLSGYTPIFYERYFLKEEKEHQIRVQRKGDLYELETKIRKIVGKEENIYQKSKKEISKETFIELTKNCKKVVIRESYQLNDVPNVTLKVYHREYEGLARLEIEYEKEEQMKQYLIPSWAGKEITNSKLGMDVELIKLTKEEFLSLLKQIKEN